MRKSQRTPTNPRYPTFWEHIWIFSTKNTPDPSGGMTGSLMGPRWPLRSLCCRHQWSHGFVSRRFQTNWPDRVDVSHILEYSVYKSTNDIKHIFIYIYMNIYIYIYPYHAWTYHVGQGLWQMVLWFFRGCVWIYLEGFFLCHQMKLAYALVETWNRSNPTKGERSPNEYWWIQPNWETLQYSNWKSSPIRVISRPATVKVSTSSSVSTQFLFNC